MRELALVHERAEASANPTAEPSHASEIETVSKRGSRGRILEASVEPRPASPDVEPADAIDRAVVSAAWELDTASDVDAPGLPKVSKAAKAAPRDRRDEMVMPLSVPVTAIEKAPTTRSTPTAPGWQERRLALRRKLPLEDRWKWDLPS
ncbi:hypothetical protein [Aureimonas pseudogalii]|uniref:Uncharacterized protein n=2 Tax=Aureimonas pseudogalii TaxID=1744844 RepID=A0A7W6MMK4_9HYPH|nr:hypothetical protein [Aureimonas pseudogalii]MBB4000945.1 hypothetical protein [Aureimonas pseudogalii]